MDKLKQIEAFVLVVDKGSLAAAALEEKVTPVMMGGASMRWKSGWAPSSCIARRGI
jgi:hypothetical protein